VEVLEGGHRVVALNRISRFKLWFIIDIRQSELQKIVYYL